MALGGLGAKDILIQLKGDNRNFKSSLDDTDKSMGKFTDSVLKAGPAMAAAFAVGTAALVASSVKIAAAEEVVDRQTESMLKSQGIMWGSVKDEVADYIDELERLTSYGDTDLQMAFNRMISAGLGYKNAMESMNMVTDIAYTLDISVVAAADLVSKAYNGRGSSLARYGIILDSTLEKEEALIAVSERVNATMADAEDRTETLEGKTESLANIVDDFQGNLGREVIPELTSFSGALVEAGGGADELGTFLGRLVSMPIKLPRMLGEHTADMITLNKLRKAGYDTEEEFVNLLQLEGEELANMSEVDFERNKALLAKAGYEERAAKVEKARLYGINMQNRALKEQEDLAAAILATEEATTAEVGKQLSMRERAKAALIETQRAQTSGSRFGTSAAGLRETAGAYAAGATYTRESGAHTIHANRSGAP